jgi:hypothetical protein
MEVLGKDWGETINAYRFTVRKCYENILYGDQALGELWGHLTAHARLTSSTAAVANLIHLEGQI